MTAGVSVVMYGLGETTESVAGLAATGSAHATIPMRTVAMAAPKKARVRCLRPRRRTGRKAADSSWRIVVRRRGSIVMARSYGPATAVNVQVAV